MITLNNSNIDFGFEDESLGSKYSISLSSDTSNLVFRTEDIKRMTIMKNGKVGIGKTETTYNLDVNGSINAGSYLINGQDISIITSDTSNYIRNTSNILIGRINNTSNYLGITSDVLIGQINDTSNYLGITSNILIVPINNTSNYVLNTSNILIGRIIDTSNYMKDTSNMLIKRINDTSNYIRDTSNILIVPINNTSNYAWNTNDILVSSISNTSNYVKITSNILIVPINDTSNYMMNTSDILVISISDTSNYVRTTSNMLISRIIGTSNYMMNTSDILVSSISDTSNYVKMTSNMLVSRIMGTSNYMMNTSNNLVSSISNTSNYVKITSDYMLNLVNSSTYNRWHSNNSMIYYNNYNVGIGTNNSVSKLHLYDEVSNTTSLTMNNFILPPIITSTSTPAPETTDVGIHRYIIFKYTTDTAGASTGQTQYTITIPSGIVCEILMVGGGGAGGKLVGGGGGGGAVLYGSNITIPPSSYIIKVGRGTNSGETIGGFSRGASTTGFNATILGGGNAANIAHLTLGYANSGGSGGGGKFTSTTQPAYTSNAIAGTVGTSTIGNILTNATLYNGNNGGDGFRETGGGSTNMSGGGGGAGTVGTTPSKTPLQAGNGGNGVPINILGNGYYWGAGGGGASINLTNMGNGGLGGGGAGERNEGTSTYGTQGGNSYSTAPENKLNACPHTGSGGGGGGNASTVGGIGGSGIIIIKYTNVIKTNGTFIEFKNFTTNYYNIVNYNDDFKITSINSSQTNDRLVIKSSGFVGIGTTTPGYMLEVFDDRPFALASFREDVSGIYFKSSSISGLYTNSPYNPTPQPLRICAKFNDSILLTNGTYVISSDIRIKEDIQDINDDYALQKILAIELKKYKYIDKINKGDGNEYGFIAQQVKNVIPDAVNIEKSYIPNIMMVAEYNNKIVILPYKPTKVTIKIKDKIKCYDSKNKLIEVEVYEIINEVSFKIKDLDKEYTSNKIFVYGTYIDDFHTLFKDHIFALNIGATQELYRQLKKQKEIIRMQNERIDVLEIDNDELENKFKNLLKELELIKKIL